MVSRRVFLREALQGAFAATVPGSLVWQSGGPRLLVAPLQGPRASRDFQLTAGVASWDVGNGIPTRAWAFNGQIPGPELRVREGDVVRVTFLNNLPESTTIHWHGVPVPFAMDGVPDLTQAPIPPGATFVYEFVASVPGSYWYHSHFGYQIERGLFGALIIEPKRESLSYDREYTLVLDDWLNDVEHLRPSIKAYNMSVGGVMMGSGGIMMGNMGMSMEDPAGTPDLNRAPQRIDANGPHAGHGSPLLEPVFDGYTINGRLVTAAPPLVVKRGQRIRLRLINAATSTVFPIYLAGHRLTVTHTDGQPITPYQADVVAVGMGERVDVLVEMNNPGAWLLGSSDPKHVSKGMGTVVRYSDSGSTVTVGDAVPRPRLSEFPYREMSGAEDQRVGTPDRHYSLVLSVDEGPHWMINDKMYPDTERLVVKQGERIRLKLSNQSPYAHPIHLHGHFFDLVRPYAANANVARPVRKDTLTLYHMDEHVIEFTANNPGPRWFVHCHNQYHHVGGMATEINYI